MKHGFVKIASTALPIRVADCTHNAAMAVQAIEAAAQLEAAILVLPELCLTGYSCADLFLQQALLQGALMGLDTVRAATESHPGLLVFVGLPLEQQGQLFNCAAALYCGKILGVIPKSCVPNHGESSELRYFAPAPNATRIINLLGQSVPFGTRLLFQAQQLPELTVGCEIGEDFLAPLPPSTGLALAGATVIVNLSASSELVGRSDFRRTLVQSQSARLLAGYVYCSAGEGESTQDLVFSGHQILAENGIILQERQDFAPGMVHSELDLFRLCSDRRRMRNFTSSSIHDYTLVPFDLPLRETVLTRYIAPQPFVPIASQREARCEEILRLQVAGLCKRLEHTRTTSVVIGVSGGLDSTLALLVSARAFDRLGLDRKGIQAITMPCFGTTNRTRSNAHNLADELGTTLREIPIGEAVAVHFRDIGLSEDNRSVTYENAQARERTQVLMDVANLCGGMVIGTGDLSELALGWATYNGDHMSMYSVNCGVPKTLAKYVISTYGELHPEFAPVLGAILDTPISPELLPASDSGEIVQKTEEKLGKYDLHDFILYHVVRSGFSPEKIFALGSIAFPEVSADELKSTMQTFYRRFFSQQFKRNCVPDGVKVGSVCLSPRGDWRMPSEASVRLWTEFLEG